MRSDRFLAGVLSGVPCLLGLALCALLSLHAHANTAARSPASSAGQVDFVLGTVIAHGVSGESRTLQKSASILSGDTIDTGEGRVQIRFIDGAYVSLLPQTRFQVREYRFDGATDGNETGFFALVQGTIRIVTGAIGRINRSRFSISTPTATIGVRGTGGAIEVAADGTTRLYGTSGIWTVSNAAGALLVPAGTATLVTPDDSLPPRIISQQPLAPPAALAAASVSSATWAPPQGAPHRSGEERIGSASEIPIAPPGAPSFPPVGTAQPPSESSTPSAPGGTVGSGEPMAPPLNGAGSTVAAAYAYGVAIGGGGTPTIVAGSGVLQSPSVARDAVGAITRIGEFSLSASAPHGHVRDAGSDGGLAWGRWTRAIDGVQHSSATTLGENEGFHFVVGATTRNVPTANPGATAYVHYALGAGSATSPTIIGTSPVVPAGTLANGRMGVDFTTGRIGVELKASFAGFDVDMRTAGGVSNPRTSQVAITPGSATFSGTFEYVGVSGPRPAPFCTAGCSGGVNGFFAGDAAERAAIVYRAGSPAPGNGNPELQGAAVLFRQ